MWHNIWKSNGRPSSDTIHHINSSTQFQYKKAIKDAFINFEHNNNDYIDAHFRGKSNLNFGRFGTEFSKFIDKEISINSLNDNLSIANAFANQFGSIYYDSGSDSKCKQNFFNFFDKYVDNFSVDDVKNSFNIEVIDKCIRNLKPEKACDPDELSAEHLQHAHPIITKCILNPLDAR